VSIPKQNSICGYEVGGLELGHAGTLSYIDKWNYHCNGKDSTNTK